MRILYVGAQGGTSLQRARAAARLGHDVTHVDPYRDLPRLWRLWANRTGGPGIDARAALSLGRQIGRQIGQEIGARGFDLAHVDSGDVTGPACLALLRRHAPRLSLYNADNPFADPAPERRRWRILHRALPGFDLVAGIGRPGLAAAMAARGVRRGLLLRHAADEIVHAPLPEPGPRWQADVCFAGTWMPGRERVMAALADAGIGLALYGPRWERAPNIARLRPHLRGGELRDRDYARAIAGARIALVLLNGANGDLHTSRSVEIPAIGTAMVAPRTADHLSMYREGSEAMFFDDDAGCVRACRALLADPPRRAALAAAGQARARADGHGNQALMARILAAATEGGG